MHILCSTFFVVNDVHIYLWSAFVCALKYNHYIMKLALAGDVHRDMKFISK